MKTNGRTKELAFLTNPTGFKIVLVDDDDFTKEEKSMNDFDVFKKINNYFRFVFTNFEGNQY